MKWVKHYYHITIIQFIVLFILTATQGYLSLFDLVALSCRCPSCGLWDAVLFDSFIAMVILSSLLPLIEKLFHLAKIRFYLHGLSVLTAWLVIDFRIFWERANCDGVRALEISDLIMDALLPILVGLAIYLPVYRWARKQIALLK